MSTHADKAPMDKHEDQFCKKMKKIYLIHSKRESSTHFYRIRKWGRVAPHRSFQNKLNNRKIYLSVDRKFIGNQEFSKTFEKYFDFAN